MTNLPSASVFPFSTVEVPEGTTVLKASQMAGANIPTLCDFPALKPYGGCRMCVVEIEGFRRRRHIGLAARQQAVRQLQAITAAMAPEQGEVNAAGKRIIWPRRNIHA